jgi:hypothetical protein
MATGRYAEAVAQYTRAVQLAPAFSFAAANKTLGLYAAGRTDQAMREMRCARAGLAAPTRREMQGQADAWPGGRWWGARVPALLTCTQRPGWGALLN